jgi:hypothetical protein
MTKPIRLYLSDQIDVFRPIDQCCKTVSVAFQKARFYMKLHRNSMTKFHLKNVKKMHTVPTIPNLIDKYIRIKFVQFVSHPHRAKTRKV